MHGEWHVEVFERVPQRLVKAVVQPMASDRHRIDMHCLEAKLPDAAPRLARGFLGIAQVHGGGAEHPSAGL
ncbi:MAG: hypothetical protein WCA59_21970 [Candidatus Binataceae bacterium]